MVQEIKAPDRNYVDTMKTIKVFLAGSIEMGAAEKWHSKVITAISESQSIQVEQDDGSLRVLMFNPRRDDWDSTWVQDPTPGTKFNEQVTWELDHIGAADIVFFYFDPSTKSPISLLELGLCLGQQHCSVIVVCPPEFYRYGNVKLTMEDWIEESPFHTLDEGIEKLIKNILDLSWD